MIESLMLIALGFFVATLFAAIAAQFVWRRAVTVTRRNLLETEAEAAEDVRVRELDDLIQRHRRETAPLEAEVSRLSHEKDALASSNDDLARENTDLARVNTDLSNEINALRNEAERLRSEAEGLRAFISQNGALAAERVAILKQEIYALEAVIGASPEPGPAPVAAPAPPPEPAQAVAQQADAPQEEISVEPDEAERTLAEVKASLARLDAMTADDRTAPSTDDRLTEPHIGDKALLARIKALEAGVAN